MLEKNSSHSWEWVDSHVEAEKLVSQLIAAGELALDTEFHRERTYYPRLALVQIAWNNRIVLIDPFAIDLHFLAPVFEAHVTVVFHAGTQDLDILDRTVGVLPRTIFDTQLAAGFIGFSNPSLALVSEKLMGVHVPKGDRLTDWTQRPLSESQLKYAASDVANLLEIKRIIEERLIVMDRLGWALDESKILLTKDRGDIPPERAWWKIKECRHLKGDSRKVAQALAAWREIRAARLDIPVRYVLSDLAVAVISQDLPSSTRALGSLRGVEPRFLSQGVDSEIIETVSAARQMSDDSLCIPFIEESEKRLKPIASLAIIWLAQLSQQLKVDPLLLATRSDVTSFLNGDPNSRLAKGWRNAVLGDAITKLSKGELALAVETTGELVLEKRSFSSFGGS